MQYLKPNGFDRDLIAIADVIVGPNDCVWYIGANLGIFGFAVAMHTSAPVVMIEADRWLCGLLQRTGQLPAYAGKDVRVLSVAVADEVGVEEFLIAKRGRASNALQKDSGRSQMGGVRERVHVPVMSLDSLAGSWPPGGQCRRRPDHD